MPANRKSSSKLLPENQACASLLVDALAWAVVRDIPFQAVIRTLPMYAPPGKPKRWLTGKIGQFTYKLASMLGLAKKGRWGASLCAIVQALDAGEKLSDALCGGQTIYRLHAHPVTKYLPSFFPGALHYAEEQGRLREALPLLAQQIRDNRCAPEETLDRLSFCFMKLGLISMSGLIAVYISQKLSYRIHEDFCEYGDFELHSLDFLFGSGFALMGGLGLIAFFSFLILLVTGLRLSPDRLIPCVPFFRHLHRRGVISETAACLRYFLQSGTTMPEALSFAMGATRSRMMEQKLHMMLQDIEAGLPWQESWIRRKIGMPHDNWFVQNAAQRENPAEGLAQIDRWNQQQNERATTVIVQLIDPVAMIVIGVVVGVFAHRFFLYFSELYPQLVAS